MSTGQHRGTYGIYRVLIPHYPELRRLRSKSSTGTYIWTDGDNPFIRIDSIDENPFDSINLWTFFYSGVDDTKRRFHLTQLDDKRVMASVNDLNYKLIREVVDKDKFVIAPTIRYHPIFAVFCQIGKHRKVPTGNLLVYSLHADLECET